MAYDETHGRTAIVGGEEPYTVAILVEALAGPSPNFVIRIVGTDVDASALRTARAAEYAEKDAEKK